MCSEQFKPLGTQYPSKTRLKNLTKAKSLKEMHSIMVASPGAKPNKHMHTRMHTRTHTYIYGERFHSLWPDTSNTQI